MIGSPLPVYTRATPLHRSVLSSISIRLVLQVSVCYTVELCTAIISADCIVFWWVLKAVISHSFCSVPGHRCIVVWQFALVSCKWMDCALVVYRKLIFWTSLALSTFKFISISYLHTWRTVIITVSLNVHAKMGVAVKHEKRYRHRKDLNRIYKIKRSCQMWQPLNLPMSFQFMCIYLPFFSEC